MLAPTGIRVPDWPAPFQYAHANHDANSRTFLPFIECLLPDEEAWESLFTDAQRLDVFRSIYGNRQGKRKPKAEPSLFDDLLGSIQ